METIVKMRCRAEIGRPGHHWHECGRPAVVRSVRQLGNAIYDVEYCARHADRASKGSGVVRVLKVETLT